MTRPYGNGSCRAGLHAPRGFSLLELLVVLTIFGLLLSVAVPSYQKYTYRGYRADAVRSLLAIAACQERVRAASGYYDTRRCLDGLDQVNYRFALEPADLASANRFTARAIPLGSEPGEACGTLSIDQAGTRAISGDPERRLRCWNGR